MQIDVSVLKTLNYDSLQNFCYFLMKIQTGENLDEYYYRCERSSENFQGWV